MTEGGAHVAGLVQHRLEALDDIGGRLLNDRGDDLVLAAEVVVEAAGRYRGLAANLIGGRTVEAAAQEAGPRGVDNLLPS